MRIPRPNVIWKLLMICLLIPCMIHANVSVAAKKQMREAEAYFESHNYAQALDHYQNILQEPLEPWERAIVMFNLGCVWLASGHWEDAITTFRSVPLDNPLSPLLSDRIQRNVMLTYLRQAVAISKSEKDLSKGIELLNQVIDMAPLADQAHCTLQKAEGTIDCQPSFDVASMKSIAQNYLASLLEKEIHPKKEAPLKDLLQQLLNAVTDAALNSKFLHLHEINRKLKKQYRLLFKSELSESLPRWRLLQQKINNDNQEGSSERKALLQSAEKKFSEGRLHFNQMQYEMGSQFFDASAKDLQDLIAKLPPPPPSAPSESQQEQQEAPQEQTPTQKEDTTVHVLQQLLQMEQQDKLPKSEQQIRKKELRPW